MYPSWLVVVLGLGIVFVGLISLVFICYITGIIFGREKRSSTGNVPVAATDSNDKAVVAAISAAIAAETGKDLKSIKILSINKK